MSVSILIALMVALLNVVVDDVIVDIQICTPVFIQISTWKPAFASTYNLLSNLWFILSNFLNPQNF